MPRAGRLHDHLPGLLRRPLAAHPLATDMIFADSASLELATTTGSVSGGYTATLTVAV